MPTSAPFVPASFQEPATLETPEFKLRMLTVNDLVKDFDAVVTSTAHLRDIFDSGSWPEGLTLEQNLIDLGWHQKEFQRRTSFACTVLNPTETQVVGCVYINPTHKQDFDASVLLWARQSVLASGLEDRLHAAVQAWLASAWPFRAVIHPGRSIGRESRECRARSGPSAKLAIPLLSRNTPCIDCFWPWPC